MSKNIIINKPKMSHRQRATIIFAPIWTFIVVALVSFVASIKLPLVSNFLKIVISFTLLISYKDTITYINSLV